MDLYMLDLGFLVASIFHPLHHPSHQAMHKTVCKKIIIIKKRSHILEKSLQRILSSNQTGLIDINASGKIISLYHQEKRE